MRTEWDDAMDGWNEDENDVVESIRPEFEFLNRLRESGETNMFGASPFLACAFSLPKREASKILMEWMRWVEEEPSRRDL